MAGFPIVNQKEAQLWEEVVHACLDRNVNYVCTVGRECESLHDWFDEIIVMRQIHNNLPVNVSEDFIDKPITTWHSDFEEGFWFSIIAAHNADREIDKVVCLDMTGAKYRNRLEGLLAKINEGWVPK